jgi:hypothetical protein
LLEQEFLQSLDEALRQHSNTFKAWNRSLGTDVVCSLDEFSKLAEELDISARYGTSKTARISTRKTRFWSIIQRGTSKRHVLYPLDSPDIYFYPLDRNSERAIHGSPLAAALYGAA